MSNGLIPQGQFLENYRNKYPEYDAIDDSTLLDAVFQKHPQYKDQVELDEPEPVTNPEFDPDGAGLDYRAMTMTKEMYGPYTREELQNRDVESGRMLIGTQHEDFGPAVEAQNELGNVVYRGDDGNVYSHPKDSVEVSADSIFSGELADPDSSAEKLDKYNLTGPDTSEKELHSTDWSIPQINDTTWNKTFKDRFGKDISDSLPEEAIAFAIEEILQNKSGLSPQGIQNWTAYNNGAWAQYKDWTNEQYISVMGADPKHLDLIDQLAGGDASTIKAVFAAESGFDSTARKENYRPSTATEEPKTPEEPEGFLSTEPYKPGDPALRAAPEQGFWSGVSDVVRDVFKYKDLYPTPVLSPPVVLLVKDNRPKALF